MQSNKLKNTYIIFTCTFLLILPFVFLPFITGGRSFVWYLDGLDQHYPSLLYYGKLLRGLLTGRGFPMMDFSVGMGFDTITTMNYYVIGDPISLLSIFMTANNGVYFYTFLILFRFYLAGISFITLMKYTKRDGMGVILGAMIYVFSGYSLYAGLRHPFFMNPMIYLPLIIMGIEKVLKGKKPYLLITMVFITLISNFYFFYALTIIAVIYIIFRYFAVYRKNYNNIFTGLLWTGLKTGKYYLLGSALASVVFIPVLYAFSRNGRLGIKPGMVSGSNLYYQLKYYIHLFQGTVAPGISPGYWTVLSFSAVTIASIAVLICNKKYRQLQLIYLLSFIGLFIPAFGYFMNGSSYDSNRWCFVISLLTAITFTFTYEKLLHLEKKEKIILSAGIIVYGILAFLIPSARSVKWTFILLLVFLIIILLLQTRWFHDKKSLGGSIIFILVLISLGFNGYGLYSNLFHDNSKGSISNYSKEFLSNKDIKNTFNKGTLTMLKDIRDNSFYRIEIHGDKALNEALALGYNGVSAYFSLMDGTVTSYMKEQELLSQVTADRFHNMDDRSILDTLADVKYYITNKEANVPYGYNLLKEETSGDQKYYLYQNNYALPLGFTYKNYILKTDYERLSALEKQNAMLNAVVLDNNSDYAVKADQAVGASIKKLDVSISHDSKVSMENNMIDVKEAGATITMNFTSIPNSETYIRLGKFNINEKADIQYDLYAEGDSGVNKKINVRSAYVNSYFGKENYLINIGYSPNGQSRAVITFPEPMTFSYGSIEAYCVDMSNYSAQVKSLGNEDLTNIKMTRNKVQGDITLDTKGIMLLDIPYSKGWSASVDGVKQGILNANIMYMALPLEAGSHHIVLRYQTPYLKTGFLVSIIAFLILIGIIIYDRRTRIFIL